jgi:hypothetical protein
VLVISHDRGRFCWPPKSRDSRDFSPACCWLDTRLRLGFRDPRARTVPGRRAEMTDDLAVVLDRVGQRLTAVMVAMHAPPPPYEQRHRH